MTPVPRELWPQVTAAGAPHGYRRIAWDLLPTSRRQPRSTRHPGLGSTALLQVPVLFSAPREQVGGGGFPHLSPFGLHPSALRQEFDKRFGGSRRPRTRSGGLPARRPDGIASAGHKLRAAHTVVEDVFWGSTPTTVDNATFGGLMTPGSADQPIRPVHWDVTAQMLEVCSRH